MSAGSNLQGAGGQTLEQRVANIEAALRGGPPVIDALGVPTDDDVDLGSALNAWRDIFANGLVVGGARVDVAGLATATRTYVFDADDAAFLWPANRTKALMLLWSAGGGGGGGGGEGNLPRPDSPGEDGGTGGTGNAVTVTIAGVTYSSGGGVPGGAGGAAGGVSFYSGLVRSISDYSMTGAIGGQGGGVAGGGLDVRGQGGGHGRLVFKHFGHAGLSEGDVISIVAPAGGAGGIGGAGNGSAAAGEDGMDGRPGLAIILALP